MLSATKTLISPLGYQAHGNQVLIKMMFAPIDQITIKFSAVEG